MSLTLTAKILNSDASLNSFQELSSLEFFPGTDQTLVLRLHDKQEDLRFVPPSSAVLDVYFQTTTGEFKKTAILNSDDRSIATISLSSSDTEDMIGGNIRLELDHQGNGSQISKGIVERAIHRLVEC